MPPDNKSESFTFHKNALSSGPRARKMQNCRRRLQDTFEDGDSSGRSGAPSLDDTRRMLRLGGERIARTLSGFRTSLGAFTQKFRIATKRRRILEEGPMTPGATPQTQHVRNILGRTPTKLYSPFSIESPYRETTCGKENVAPKQNK